MEEKQTKVYLEKIKPLEGMTENEWKKIKSIIDESFEREKREQEIRLSLKTTETILKTNLFV